MAKNMGFVDFSFLLKPQGVRRNGHKNIQFISRHAVIGIQMGQAALFILLSALGPDGPGWWHVNIFVSDFRSYGYLYRLWLCVSKMSKNSWEERRAGGIHVKHLRLGMWLYSSTVSTTGLGWGSNPNIHKNTELSMKNTICRVKNNIQFKREGIKLFVAGRFRAENRTRNGRTYRARNANLPIFLLPAHRKILLEDKRDSLAE